MKRKILTFLVATIGSVFLYAGVAYAWHTTISGSTQCSNGVQVVTWHLTNSQSGFSAVGSLTSNRGGLSTSSVNLPPAGTVTVTQTLGVSFTGTVTLTANVTWSNGTNVVNSGQVVVSQSCVPVTTVAPTTTVVVTTTHPVTTTSPGSTTVPVTTTAPGTTTTAPGFTTTTGPPIDVLGIRVQSPALQVQGVKKAAAGGALPATGESTTRQVSLAIVLVACGLALALAGHRRKMSSQV